MPVVINSGSGNQGITLTMPLVVYAEANAVEHDRLLRALALANLIALHEKRFIGSLSAYCGAVSAATASACGVAYMLGASYDVICGVLTNSLNTTGGMVCDGAKSSCAAKIATAVGMALLAMEMSLRDRVFREGEGLVEADVEQTIRSIGRMGRVGMKATDVEILNIMLGN
jgi:L-cysteine desulfidase